MFYDKYYQKEMYYYIYIFVKSYLKGHKLCFIFSDYGKKCIKENNLTSV